jgi:hypothetical protein
VSGERNREFPHEVRVNVKGFKRYRGYSDLVPTYCCSSQASYYVVFPSIEYEGYFLKWDVQVKRKGGGSSV